MGFIRLSNFPFIQSEIHVYNFNTNKLKENHLNTLFELNIANTHYPCLIMINSLQIQA